MKRSHSPPLPSCYEIPHIEFQGKRFRSDRFYLNATPSEEEGQPKHEFGGERNARPSSSSSSSFPPHAPPSGCTCGSLEAPPPLPLESFLQSLDLEAAILGTYVLAPKWLARTLPQLVGGDGRKGAPHVPTLILHGHKGLKEALMEEMEQGEASDYETECEDYVEDDNEDQENSQPPLSGVGIWTLPVGAPKHGAERGDLKISTESPPRMLGKDPPSPPLHATNSRFDGVHSQRSTPNSSSKQHDSKSEMAKVAQLFRDSPHLHMSQVQSNWKRTNPLDGRVTRESTVGTKLSASEAREFKRGVHHPKFMLLFEKSGSLIVIVTTANLTPAKTVEGTFLQRFLPIRGNGGPTVPAINKADMVANDFGPVLQDFLSKLSESAVEGSGTIVDTFLSQYKQFPLKELSTKYHFAKAQAHLVPVIPGDYVDEDFASTDWSTDATNGSRNKRRKFFYGRQRVQFILATMAKHVPKISKRTQDGKKSDRLLLQPTSLGANWTRQDLADLVRGYMGYSREDSDKDDFWVCSQTDIIWPSDKYIKNAGGSSLPAVTPVKEAREQRRRGDGGIVFNSSKTFNDCDLEFVARMALYETSAPPQLPTPKVPHFKSVARVFQNHAAMQKRFVPEADAYFSWFLLTSACLSHGAQGVRSDPFQHDTPVCYRNFELGVLFTSHLPKATKSSNTSDVGTYDSQQSRRVYCFRPKDCSCQPTKEKWSIGSISSLVHLPIPYSCRPESYFDRDEHGEEDTSRMNENPFFHQILDESRCVGNMLLTPYGRTQAQLLLKEEISQKRQKLETFATATAAVTSP